MIDRNDARAVLAATLWGEARGDGRLGMVAVAGCVLNRARHPRWWGHDILSVCLDPWQFSCWNDNDPNLPQIEAVTAADPDYAMALDIARGAIAGMLIDLTLGADSYYDSRMPAPPEWAARATPTTTVKHHRYMRVELGVPSGMPDAPPVSMHSPAVAALAPTPTADTLNAAELATLAGV